LTLLLAGSAGAEPQAITDAKQQAEALRAQVEQLNDRLEMAIEGYNTAQAKLEQTQAGIKDNQAKLERSERDLKVASERYDQRMRGIYKDGRLGFWEAVFSSKSFSEFVNRLDLLGKVGAQDGQMYRQIAAYQTEVTDKKAQLAAQRKQQEGLLAQASDAKETVADGLAERERALAGKESQIAQLEAEEQARQERLAAEARAAAARAQQAAGRPAGGSGSSGGSSSRPAPAPARNVPPSRSGGSATDIAMQYLGVPYVWAGASPSGFDCSGLVQYVYGKLGIYLPHSSQMQFGYGTPVARGELQPGDLVFFGSDIHHVGIYVGGGNMIHAPYTGAVVRINSMDRRDYAGARRL